MKKLTKLLSALMVGLLLCAVLCGCNVSKSSLNANANDFTKNWMSYISDSTLVKDIIIPGSNDSGLSNCSRFAKTQHFSTAEQLDFGVRYLEMNVRNVDDELYTFYGSSKGEKLADILSGVLAFLKEHKTETVVLDFSAFNNQPQKQIVSLIKKYFVPNGSYTYIVRNLISSTLDEDFFNTLSLSQAKGRVIVFMDGDGNDYLDETFIFKRNNNQGTRLFTSLQSYYNKQTNNASSKKYIATLDSTLQRYATYGEGFRVLQGQLHDGKSLLGPAYYESKHDKNMSEYIDSLATSPNLAKVNIITRNFIDCTKACQILALNSANGNVKTAMAEQFQQEVSQFN